MKTKFVIICLLIPILSIGQDFKLFKSKKEKDGWYGQVFLDYAYDTVIEQIQIAPNCGRLEVVEQFEKDSMELFLVPKKRLEHYSKTNLLDTIILVTHPSTKDTYRLEKQVDTT